MKTAKVAGKNKLRFDKHVTELTQDVGDHVIVRNVRLKGKHELADKWESLVYVVDGRMGDLPVYTVMPEGKDVLLPSGLLPSNPTEKPQPKRRPVTRQMMHVSDGKCSDLSSGYNYLAYHAELHSSESIRFTRIYTSKRSPEHASQSSPDQHFTVEQADHDMAATGSGIPQTIIDNPAIGELCEEQIPDNLGIPRSPTNAIDLPPESLACLEGESESTQRDDGSPVVLKEESRETDKHAEHKD